MSAGRAAARPPRALPIPLLLLAALGAATAAAVPAQDDRAVAEIPRPVGFVTDFAGVMDEPARARLESFLVRLRERTGVELAVLTLRSTAPETPESYKTRVFESWKLGREDLLMLVALEERRVVFENGYEIEGTLPDGLQSRIIRERMRDRFRAGDFSGGITAGVLACAERIAAEKGVALEWDGHELRYAKETRDPPPWVAIALVIVVAAILIGAAVGAAQSGMPGWGGRSWTRRRRRGWGDWHGWGGGFGGGSLGGGSFGGGGFGGFSGGGGGGFSSGGGGGGGSW